MGTWVPRVVACGLFVLLPAGCSTVGESLGFNTPTSPLTKTAKSLRDTAPVPAPVPRELALDLLPAHVVEPGDTLLVQPVELDAPVHLPPDQPVQPDGTIDLGTYGRPVVAGLTLPQIESRVRELIKKDRDAKDVAITVRLLARPGKVFYVLGEVNAPGAFPITGRDTVLAAITQAGGPTRRASEQNVVLSRPTAPDGCRVVLPVCYTNIVQLGDTTTNYQVMPGDRIFVPSKGALEGFFSSRHQRLTAACGGPQVSCFGGGCVAGSNPVPAVDPPRPGQ